MTAPAPDYPRVRWYHSLIFRVIASCVVLVLCLMGSVYELSRHFFGEMVREMEDQAQDVANSIVLLLQQFPDADLNDVENRMKSTYGDGELKLSPYTDATEVTPFSLKREPDGRLTKIARVIISPEGRPKVLLTASVTIAPQTEIVRAFRNKYLALLAFVFVLTLGFMIYLIMRLLRPITDLSETCAKIGSGQLQDVSTGRNSKEILELEYTFNRMVAALREKEVVEANLRQAQRLSAIGNLAAGVAHDVRNPLNAIKLLSSHAIDTLGDISEAGPAVKQLNTIRREVDRLEEIVSGFLSLAKERELRQEPYRIDLLLDECARLVAKDAEARGVRITTELRAGDTVLMVDPKQMTRAILNVLINAMEACPNGGRVRVFSRLTDQRCEIEIRDDGPGMPKEIAERAFEPYFTMKPTGTGLGLSITRGIVEEHGGKVSLMSVAQQGCQVVIGLPLESKKP